MPHQLRNIKIDEISSVRKGSARGAFVLLRKQQEDNPMNTIAMSQVRELLGPAHLARAAFEKVSKGEMSEFEYGLFQQDLAKRMFPEAPTVGHALSQLFNTEIGQSMLAPRRAQSASENAELMKREGLFEKSDVDAVPDVGGARREGVGAGSDNIDAVTSAEIKRLMMEEGLTYSEAAARVVHRTLKAAAAAPHAHRARNNPVETDDDGDESIDQKVERLMRDKNISRDAAISILHRAEKVAKGISV
jgi:hypothetical protein